MGSGDAEDIVCALHHLNNDNEFDIRSLASSVRDVGRDGRGLKRREVMAGWSQSGERELSSWMSGESSQMGALSRQIVKIFRVGERADSRSVQYKHCGKCVE